MSRPSRAAARRVKPIHSRSSPLSSATQALPPSPPTATPDTTATGVAFHPRHLEPWYFAYALLGLVQLGVAPVLLPLAAGPTVNAGVLYAAWSCAGLLAPMLGAWADHRRRHRTLLVGGIAVCAAAFATFPLTRGLIAHASCAFLAGLGAIAATTVGTMFVIGAAPRPEWERRIGTLQAFISGGQVAGLVLAGWLATHPAVAFDAAALILLAALPIAALTAPRCVGVARGATPAPPAVGGEAASAHRFHRVTLRGLRMLFQFPHGALRGFLGLWLLSYMATNAISALLPVAVTREFGQPAVLGSTAYAIGVAGSLPLFPLAGSWEARATPALVLRVGLLARGAVLVVMALAGTLAGGGGTGPALWIVLAGFVVVQIVWPLLSVASNTLSVTLSPADRGESVGLLNAASSLGAALGGIAGGAIMGAAGYGGLCAVGCLSVVLAAALTRALPSAGTME